ncbi:MAG: carboxymethylenebutenolidase [Cyclobacteriaceae bacterium]|jgi:carboxymethylenebutenolidase
MNKLTFILMMCSLIELSAQDYAIAQIENSPRHHEWVELPVNGRTLYTFVAYPEVAEKAQIVIVIHENRGLNDWARSMTDQLAEAGYIAIAPDLISEVSSDYPKTSDYPTSDDARKAIYSLEADNVTKDLDAVYAYAESLEAGNGIVSVMGFCWGGSQSFRYATNNPKLNAAMVFYGTAPKEANAFETIQTPVYGFYGGNDARVNATIVQTEEVMQSLKKSYQYEIYEGAGHAFMRRGDDPNGDQPNKDARDKAWQKIKTVLK